MSETIIQIEGLNKSYGKAKVLNDFKLRVERGKICGLIGPNGAGKTTVMKIMAGLTSQDSGVVEYFGKRKNTSSMRRLGFMIENPMVDINMTAEQNMAYIMRLKGVVDKDKISELLKFVGLGETGKKKVKAFSLGMRQRLGIAMALMSDPEILVLDEPVNGLDPEGMVEVRMILKRLAREKNVTILISSHLLAELSEMCDEYSIINHGTLVEHITADELKIKCEHHISIRTDNIEQSCAALEEKLGIKNYKVFRNEEIHVFERIDELAAISKTLTDSGFTILKFVCEGASLEEYYLSKVGGKNA